MLRCACILQAMKYFFIFNIPVTWFIDASQLELLLTMNFEIYDSLKNSLRIPIPQLLRKLSIHPL